VRPRITDDQPPADGRATWQTWANGCIQGLTPHPVWQSLGCSPQERGSADRALLDEVLDGDALARIRIYLQQQCALGHDAFRAMVEARTRRFASLRPAHRPQSITPSMKK